jgi:hypothetical protein
MGGVELSGRRGRLSDAMNKTTPLASATLLVIAILVAACGAPAASISPTPSSVPSPDPSPGASSPVPTPSPTPVPTGRVTSAAQAAALVFASDARFGQMMPLIPDLIGQSTWYEASAEADGGFSVRITTGSGDCQAGCIDRHTWSYLVTAEGEITLVGEEGEDIDLPPVAGGDAPATISLTLVAGPTCPVEQVPADPSCAPRPVAGAEVILRDPSGTEVERAISDDEGKVSFEVSPGAYYVEPQPAEGLMGVPEPVAFAVGGSDSVGLPLTYETGIR